MTNEIATQANTPMQMLQIAIEKGAGIEQMQQLMDLQERHEANQARKAYMHAMTAFKAEPLMVTKSKHVKFQTSKGVTEYDHALLADVVAAVTKSLSKYGLSHQWRTTQDKEDRGWVTVECTITHDAGHSESVSLSAPLDASGGKNPIQSIGSAVTYLQRYTLMAITGLAAKDMDDDSVASGVDDPNRQTWLDAIEACESADELKSRKAEMVTAYSNHVPKALIDAYNARLRHVKAAA